MPRDERPNFILIMPDQQRGDTLGVDGHPCLLTPNLDGLAGAGTRFHRAYTTCPSCIPARRALLTGQFPATNGMPGFVSGVPITSPTLPGCLRDAGYQTQLVGRTMHQHPPSARYGYDHVQLASGYEPDPYHEMLRAETDQVDGFGSHGLDFNGWTARPWHLDEALHPTHHVVNEALRFLENRDHTCPFFLTVSFYAPHPPLCPPDFYFDRYLRADLPDPDIGDWAQAPDDSLGLPVASPRVRLQGEALRSAQAGYFGLINHIDDQILRLLQPRGGIAYDRRNTVIVYLSDHGEMLGDHFLFRKCEPYEGSARIPFLVSGGGGLGLRAGQVIDQPVCLEDLMPTLLDLADVPVPAGVDGRSLVPFLRGTPSPEWRGYLHGEHAPCYSAQQAHHYLVDETTKYIWRPLDGSQQLFDLAADPGECRDLSAQEDAVAPWRARLVDVLRDRPEGFVDGDTLVAGRDYPGLLPHVRRDTGTRR